MDAQSTTTTILGEPMPKPIDISVRLHADMPTWPSSSGIRTSLTQSFAQGDSVNVTRLDMDVHSGTHLEAPLHFLDGAAGVESIPLELLVGPAAVVDVSAHAISGSELEAASIPAGTVRLLLRTDNSARWSKSPHQFARDFAALTPDGAAWIVEHGIRLVGVDYLSVQLYGGDDETHRILMRAGVAILEGLNLLEVEPGQYRLTCLPLRLADAEAAPARAILEALA